MVDCIESFKTVMQAYGLNPPNISQSNKVHCFHELVRKRDNDADLATVAKIHAVAAGHNNG